MVTNGTPGARIGRFVVTRQLGQGGMGTVVEARDPELGRLVALKFLREQRGGDTMRLLREAQALATISHPNVVAVYEIGTHDGAVFIAMELVEGVTLDRWLVAERRSWRSILDVFIQAGRGLAAVHERAMVHRDLKPSNVLVDRSGRARLGDFGLVSRDLSTNRLVEVTTVDSNPTEAEPPPAAPDAAHALGTLLTRTGAVLGTPRYMAPEQHAGARATHKADQFAFAVALWEALFAMHPFAGDTADELRAAIDAGRLRRDRGRGVPAWLDDALTRALSAEPFARWPNMSALLDVLERKPAPSRRRALVGLAAGGIIAAGGATAIAWWKRAPTAARIRPTRLAIVPGSDWTAIALAEALAVHLADVAWIAPAEVVARVAREHDDPAPIEALRRQLAIDSVLDVIPGAVRLHSLGGGDGVAIDEPVDAGVLAAARRIATRVRVVVAAPAVEIDATWSLPARPDVIQAYAEGLARAQRFDPLGARERLTYVTRRDPTFCRGQLMLARVLEGLGADERIAVARVARDLAAALPAVARHAVITHSFAIERDWERSVDAAAAWLAHSNESLDAAVALAKGLAWVKRHDEAAKVLAQGRTLAQCEEDLIQLDFAAYRLAERRRDFSAAFEAAKAATARARALGATVLVAHARRSEALALSKKNELEAAVAAAGEAKALAAAIGNRPDALVSLNLLGASLSTLGHLASAKAAYEEALADHEMLGTLRVPRTLLALGRVQLLLGDLAGARASVERGLTFYPPNASQGDTYFDTHFELNMFLVELDLRAGKLEVANARLTAIPASEEPYQRLRRAMAAAQQSHARDHLDTARRLLEEAMKLPLSDEDREEARMLLARVLVDARAGAAALPYLDAAVAALKQAQSRDWLALAEGLRAESLRAIGRSAEAVEAEERLLARAQDSEDVEVRTEAALVRARAGELAPARVLLADARTRGDVIYALRLAIVVEPGAATVAEAERLGLALLARQAREAQRR